MAPFLVTPGKPTETRSNSPALRASLQTISTTCRGVAFLGVGMRKRSVIGRPCESSNWALIPVPPISTHNVSGVLLLLRFAEEEAVRPVSDLGIEILRRDFRTIRSASPALP